MNLMWWFLILVLKISFHGTIQLNERKKNHHFAVNQDKEILKEDKNKRNEVKGRKQEEL